jgi:hypothetical protein
MLFLALRRQRMGNILTKVAMMLFLSSLPLMAWLGLGFLSWLATDRPLFDHSDGLPWSITYSLIYPAMAFCLWVPHGDEREAPT